MVFHKHGGQVFHSLHNAVAISRDYSLGMDMTFITAGRAKKANKVDKLAINVDNSAIMCKSS
jgi:hypothetical protein